MKEKKISFNLRTVTAVLCILVVIFGVIAFFGGKPMKSIEFRNQQKVQLQQSIENREKQIVSCEKNIETYNQQIAGLKSQLPGKQADLDNAKAAAADADAALQKAEKALDEVCKRSQYSYWYCSSSCKSLHNNVSVMKNASDEANEKVSDCQQAIRSVNDAITKVESVIAQEEIKIKSCQEQIVTLEKQMAELNGKLVGDWFVLVFKILGTILGVGGLGLLAKLLFEADEDKRLWLIACGAIAGSALLLFILTAIESYIWKIAPVLYILLNPYTYTLLAMGLFACVLLEKAKKPVVFRTVAIVAAVLAGLTGVWVGQGLICVLFATTLICLAFVIVPLVFTEYISIAKHIFLTAITFGIWQLVWIYHVTKNLNKVAGVEARKPRAELLLCMFLPLFYPYWLFKTAEYVEAYGQEKEKAFNLEILAIAFAFVCPVFATVLIQNKINVVVGKPE